MTFLCTSISSVIISIAVLTVHLPALQAQQTTTERKPFKCWTCASTSLRWNWQITGYATRLNEALFGKRCQDLTSMWEWWDHAGGPGGLQTDCTSACVTWMAERPDPSGQISDYIAVRGCLDYLMGDPDIVVEQSSCTWGQTRLQGALTGEEFYARQLTHFCMDELCNTVQSFDDLRCEQHDEKNPCFKCSLTGYWTYTCNPSIADPCKGNWCYKRALWMGNTYVEQRGCASVNPYGDSDSCGQIEEDATIATRKRREVGFYFEDEESEDYNTTALALHDRTKRGITIDYHGYACYCRDPDVECNSVVTKRPMIVVVTILLIVVLIFM